MVQVIPSRGLKVAGLLGPAAPTDKKGTSVADTSVGIGGTTQWKLAGLVSSSASQHRDNNLLRLCSVMLCCLLPWTSV